MTKYVVAVASAALLAVPEAASQSLLQKSDWQPKTFESYLPTPSIPVPCLDLDRKTKLPKRDWPIGWQANAVPPFVLSHTLLNPQVSSTSDLRRM